MSRTCARKPGGRASGIRALRVETTQPVGAETAAAAARIVDPVLAGARGHEQVVLGGAGAELKLAGSAHEALTKFAEWKPDVLVSDIGMPSEDGFELIREIRTVPRYSDLPVIMISADDRASSLNGSTPNGANALFRKPFSLKEVSRVLDELLN